MDDSFAQSSGDMRSGENNLVSPEDAIAPGIPRILFMGPRRSGKSSIEQVIFHKMSPHETLFLDTTNTVDVHLIANNNFVRFQTWYVAFLLFCSDCPIC